MKTAWRAAYLLLLTAPFTFAAEGGEGGDDLLIWKWANFLLLAAGLGYLAAKMLPPLFVARSEAIRKDMDDSARIRQDAEKRAADVDRRLAQLESEIAALHTEAQKESESEKERMAAHLSAELAKIQAQTQREIEAAAKQARSDLKRYTTQLAVQLAEQKIRARMTPATQDALVRSFVQELK